MRNTHIFGTDNVRFVAQRIRCAYWYRPIGFPLKCAIGAGISDARIEIAPPQNRTSLSVIEFSNYEMCRNFPLNCFT